MLNAVMFISGSSFLFLLVVDAGTTGWESGGKEENEMLLEYILYPGGQTRFAIVLRRRRWMPGLPTLTLMLTLTLRAQRGRVTARARFSICFLIRRAVAVSSQTAGGSRPRLYIYIQGTETAFHHSTLFSRSLVFVIKFNNASCYSLFSS